MFCHQRASVASVSLSASTNKSSQMRSCSVRIAQPIRDAVLTFASKIVLKDAYTTTMKHANASINRKFFTGHAISAHQVKT